MATYCTVERDGKFYELKTEDGKKYRKYPDRWYRICMTAFCIFRAKHGTALCMTHGARKVNEAKFKFNKETHDLCSLITCPKKVQEVDQFLSDKGERLKMCQDCRNLSIGGRKRKRQDLVNLKREKGGKCVDCSTTDLEVLQFDHIKWHGKRRPKIHDIKGKQSRREEAKLTVLRCANCHNIRSYKDGYYSRKDPLHLSDNKNTVQSMKYEKEKRLLVNKMKQELGAKCSLCNWKAADDAGLTALHFCETGKTDNNRTVSVMCQARCSDELIIAKIKKCRLLCANCREKQSRKTESKLHLSSSLSQHQ